MGQICSISTDRMNKMKNQKPFVIGDGEIKYPIYMDDIVGMGGKEIVEYLGEKMRTLDVTKKFVCDNHVFAT